MNCTMPDLLFNSLLDPHCLTEQSVFLTSFSVCQHMVNKQCGETVPVYVNSSKKERSY